MDGFPSILYVHQTHGLYDCFTTCGKIEKQTIIVKTSYKSTSAWKTSTTRWNFPLITCKSIIIREQSGIVLHIIQNLEHYCNGYFHQYCSFLTAYALWLHSFKWFFQRVPDLFVSQFQSKFCNWKQSNLYKKDHPCENTVLTLYHNRSSFIYLLRLPLFYA